MYLKLKHPFRPHRLLAAMVIAFPYQGFAAEVTQPKENVDALPEVQVTSKAEKDQPSEKTRAYTVESTSTATRLNTSIRETPQ